MAFTDQIERLRRLAQMEREVSVLQLEMLNLLAELAEAVDQLTDQLPPERGFGSI